MTRLLKLWTISLCLAFFSRQFWFFFVSRIGLAVLAPQLGEISFLDWWRKASSSLPLLMQKGLNSIVILGAWTLWRHRNDCLFDGNPPRLAAALSMAGSDLWFQGRAGAKDIQLLEATFDLV